MNEASFHYNKKNYFRQYAANWSEMTGEFLLGFTSAVSKGLEGTALLNRVLQKWLKLPKKLFNRMSVAEAEDLYRTVEFLFTEEKQGNDLLIPKIKFRGRTYYGPWTQFRNITVAEYALADAKLLQYLTTKDEKELSLLIAALYRPSSLYRRIKHITSAEDVRRKFNGRLAERRAKRFAKLPAAVRLAVLVNFTAYRSYVVKTNDFLFSAKQEDGPNFGFSGIIHSLAGPEVGTVEEVGAMLLSNALFILRKVDSDNKRKKK
jgi:hypothetical protein